MQVHRKGRKVGRFLVALWAGISGRPDAHRGILSDAQIMADIWSELVRGLKGQWNHIQGDYHANSKQRKKFLSLRPAGGVVSLGQ